MRFSSPKNMRLNWVILGKIFIFFFPNMKNKFDERIHSKDVEKSLVGWGGGERRVGPHMGNI